MKKIKAENPLLMKEINVLNPMTYINGALFVIVFGIIVALGSKGTSLVDSRLPGNTTPNIPGYQQPVVGSGFRVV